MMNDLYRVERDQLRYDLHPGQKRAFLSEKKIVAIISGTQGGKTSFGPLWLLNEIKKMGQGDYLVATPTYKLLRLKALPEFRKLFEDYFGLGQYIKAEEAFIFSKHGSEMVFGHRQDYRQDVQTRVVFGHAQNPDSLESATAKAVWADEAGQRQFRIDSYEALMRRLSIHEGRILITTTPYNFGWLKKRIYDPWRQANKNHSYIEVVNFESRMNPVFPDAEWERAKSDLPKWKFDMMYRGMFTRPAGMIYDKFDTDRDVVSPFEIPNNWQRFWGLDFGGVNTACVKYARDPSNIDNKYLYQEYLSGNKSIEQHVNELMKNEPEGASIMCFGGAGSEQQWRDEFTKHGLRVKKPKVSEVEVGISRVYKEHVNGTIKVFETCDGYIEEKQDYSREVDENGNATEKIQNKEKYHRMDGERYVISSIPFVTSGDWTELASLVEEEEQWI